MLDNLEHLLDAAPQISELVLNAPAVKAILSSRAPLRVSGEREYPVPELADDDAVALFSERAQAIKPDFQPERRCAGRRRDLPAPGRPSACDRAGCGPREGALSDGPARAARPAAPRADRRRPGRPGPPAHAPGHDRVELRAARRDRAEALRAARRLRRRLHARGSRAGLRRGPGHGRFPRREEPRPPGRGPVPDARDDPRVRLERLEESGELEEIRRRHVDFFLALAEREDSDIRASVSGAARAPGFRARQLSRGPPVCAGAR